MPRKYVPLTAAQKTANKRLRQEKKEDEAAKQKEERKQAKDLERKWKIQILQKNGARGGYKIINMIT